MTTSSAEASTPWRVLSASLKAKVSLSMTLCGGQCFLWYPTPRSTFVGTIGHTVFELREVYCALKREKIQGVPSERSALSASQRGKRKRESTSCSLGSESIVGGRHWASCCWVEYRRLWPVDLTLTVSKESRTCPLLLSPSNGVTPITAVEESDEGMLSRFLSLDVNLDHLWRSWTDSPETREHPLVAYLVGNTPLHQSLPGCRDQRICEHDVAGWGSYIPVRHLRQDLHSCLFSFLCSQNNNVTRITGMIKKLCRAYGDHLCDVQLTTGEVRVASSSPVVTRSMRANRNIPQDNTRGGEGELIFSLQQLSDCSSDAPKWLSMFSFPSLDQLATATEDRLRQLGFGYRSKYIVNTVTYIRTQLPPEELQDAAVMKGKTCLPLHILQQHGDCYLNAFYAAVLSHHRSHQDLYQRDLLLLLPGVGRKVADCVMLFSLGRTDIVPVDTHMAQVAVGYLVAPDLFPVASGKCSHARRSVGERKRSPWRDVLVAWSKQAEALKRRRKCASSATLQAAEGGARTALARARFSETTPVPPLYRQQHDAIQDAFRMLFGEYAGWAHSILFYDRMRL